MLAYDKLKKKGLYGEINLTIIRIFWTYYKIKIKKDYENLNLFKNNLYMLEYNFFNKIVWKIMIIKNINSEKN